ncbi:DUF1707 and DUF4190 domain-containing protein [Streptomyces smaragdinus]|nr:DUF1707 and DUF4190 domain-containing protein [Streptomyces smaragdinus]
MQPYGPGGGSPSMRASDADRERAVDVLRAGFAEGRLTKTEYDDRVGRAYEAQTYADLHRLVGDLPQGPAPTAFLAPPQLPMPAMPRWGMQTPLAPPPPSRTNNAAVAALICGIGTPLTCGFLGLPALISGLVARREIRHTGESGDGMALTGIVIGAMGMALWLIFFLTRNF